MKIQPLEYALANGIGFIEANVVKYVTRWKVKGGIDDLRKARHYLDVYIAHLEKIEAQHVEDLRAEREMLAAPCSGQDEDIMGSISPHTKVTNRVLPEKIRVGPGDV
jgi:hypothetical protein